jgi:rhamnulokinase
MDIPPRLFHPVTAPGTTLGRLLPAIAEETGAPGLKVVAPACHDTGSAVVAVPAEAADFAWISSGTWSIIGTEASQPAISPQTLAYNFTNEGGVFGTWRLCKNIMGLWLVQECRRVWSHQGEDLSYDDLTRLASEARPFLAVIDTDHPDFHHPGDMPERIRDCCKSTGQPVPESKGEVIRVALESIALRYRWVLDKLEEIAGRRLETVHIMGGGARNRLLDQFAADATGRPCVAGPVEATAIGNILMQAIALGHLGSLADARAVVRASFSPEVFLPGDRSGWDEAYDRLEKVIQA